MPDVSEQTMRTLAARDGAALLYRLFPAAGEPRGALVYLHGIQSHGGWYVDTAEELARRGYSMYLTDRRGSGASTEPRGYFESREQLVEDVREFVGLARDEHPGLPVFLVGGCWGARPGVTFALESQDQLAGLVLISPALAAKVDLKPAEKLKVVAGGTLQPRSKVRIPLSPELFTRNPEWLQFIREDPLVLKEVATSFFLKQALWDKWIAKQTGLRLPLLLLQSGRDEIVDVPKVRAWFDRQKSEDKRYVLYPDFDHLLDFEDDRSRYWDDLVSWLDEHDRNARGRNGTRRVTAIDVLTVSLPFRFSFGHALAERRDSTNVFVRARLSDGSVGYGEGVPREYVTGETVDGALEALTERQVPLVLGRTFDDPDEVAALIDEIPASAPDGSLDTAARCALELALLDAAGKSFGLSVAHWLGGMPAPKVRYDAVLPFSSPRKVGALALVIRALGVKQVKAKVGGDLEKEARSLRQLRRVLGSGADIRVDANCAWSADEALAAIERLREFRLSAVEQPVPGDDLDGLRRVTEATPEAIIVDESLRTLDEARTLAETKCCDAFNIRVSKCGGLLSSMRIATVAREAGLFCVVGAQVGESGILSAAGRHLAAQIAPRYVEGSGGRFLLKEDVTDENMVPGRRGLAKTPTGPGLGVTVRDEVLERLGQVHRSFEAEAVKTG